MPVAKTDTAVIATAGDRDRAAVLLAAVDAIGEAVVHRDTVELAGGLVEPAAPACTAVESDHGALVGTGDHAAGIPGVDPQRVIVVTARRAFDDLESSAAIDGAAQRLPAGPDRVIVLGVRGQPGHVAGGQAAVGVDMLPVGAAVLGTVDTTAIDGIDRGPDALRAVTGRHRQLNAAQRFVRQSLPAYRRPAASAVGRAPDAAVAAYRGLEIIQPRITLDLPQRGIEDGGRVHAVGEVRGAGRVIDVQHLLPVFTAVFGSEQTTLFVRAENVTQRRDHRGLVTRRVDPQVADVFCVGQADVLPGQPAVGGAVNAIAVGDVPALLDLAGTHPDHLRVGRGNLQRADGGAALLFEQRFPGHAGIVGLPDAAVGRAEIEGGEFIRMTRDRGGPATPEGTDQAPAHIGVGGVRHGSLAAGERQQTEN